MPSQAVSLPTVSLLAVLMFCATGGAQTPGQADADNHRGQADTRTAAGNHDATKIQARRHFQRGVELFNQGDNEGALAEFRTANELVYHPKVWFNIGMVLAEMNQPVEAVDALDRALGSGDALDEDLKGTARLRREQLLDMIGTLQIACSTSGARVLIDGVERGTTPLHQAIPVQSGRHVVELLKDDFKLLRREPIVSGRGHFVLEVVMEPHTASSHERDGRAHAVTHEPQSGERSAREAPIAISTTEDPDTDAWRKPVAYTALALGGAGLLLSATSVFAGRSLCPGTGCPPAADDTNVGSYENWRTTAFVSAGAFALFGGAGLVLLLTAADDRPPVAISVGPRAIVASVTF